MDGWMVELRRGNSDTAWSLLIARSTMRVSRICGVTCLAVLVTLTFGCGDDPTAPPPPGAIRVLVGASGEDIILDDLRVSIANGPVRPFDSGSLDLVIPGLAPGVHMVQLEGMSTNCQVTTQIRDLRLFSPETRRGSTSTWSACRAWEACVSRR